MKNDHTPEIQQFMIEASLIDPIKDIVKKLNAGNFRDCDIKWLDARLEKFKAIAGKTLGISTLSVPRESHTILNDYNKNQYLKHFNTLLDYFKTF